MARQPSDSDLREPLLQREQHSDTRDDGSTFGESINFNWLSIIKRHDTAAFINRLQQEEALEESISGWPLLHYLIIHGEYEFVLHLFNKLSTEQLRETVNEYNPLDLALLTGQRRIAICLRLQGLQQSEPFASHNPQSSLINTDFNAEAMALAFWAVVKGWERMLERLLSRPEIISCEFRDNLAMLAYQIGQRTALSKLTQDQRLLATIPSRPSQTGLQAAGIPTIDYLSQLIMEEKWDDCLHFLFAASDAFASLRLKFLQALQSQGYPENPVALCLQAEQDFTQVPSAVALLKEKGHLYAIYVLLTQVCPGNSQKLTLLTLTSFSLESSLMAALCAFATDLDGQALIDALVVHPKLHQAVFRVENPAALLLKSLETRSGKWFPAVIASMSSKENMQTPSRLDKMHLSDLPPFLSQLSRAGLCQLTQARLANFLLSRPFSENEREYCLSLLSRIDMPTLEERIKYLNSRDEEKAECKMESPDYSDEVDIPILEDFSLLEEIRCFFQNQGISLWEDPRVLRAQNGGKESNPISQLPAVLFKQLVSYLEPREHAKLSSACVDLSKKMGLFVFSPSYQQAKLRTLHGRRITGANELLEALNQIIERGVNRGVRNRTSCILGFFILGLSLLVSGGFAEATHDNSVVKVMAGLGTIFFMVGLLSCALGLNRRDFFQSIVLARPLSFLAQTHPNFIQEVQTFFQVNARGEINPETTSFERLKEKLIEISANSGEALRNLTADGPAAPNDTTAIGVRFQSLGAS